MSTKKLTVEVRPTQSFGLKTWLNQARLLGLQLILVSVFVLLHQSALPATSEPGDFHYCTNTTFYTPNSTYQSNMNHLLSVLSSKANNKTGFYSSSFPSGKTSSSGNNTVYGLLLCRGDTEPEACSRCAAYAAQQLPDDCPKDKEAAVWNENCMVRYSNQPVYTKLQMKPNLVFKNPNMVSYAAHLSDLVQTSMIEISKRAAQGGTEKKYATTAVNFSDSETVYNMVQCTPDLSEGDCRMCLDRAGDLLDTQQRGCRVLMPSCNLRFEFYKFYTGDAPVQNTSVSPPPAGSRGLIMEPEGNKLSTKVIIPILVGTTLLGLALVGLLICLISRRRRRRKTTLEPMLDASADDVTTGVDSLQYDLATLQAATDNFCNSNKIGEGGFGSVYKGTMPSGQVVAVKRLSRSSTQGIEEFKNEMVLVANLQHRNLVRVLGFSFSGAEKLLVYEFVPNKSLNYFLFDRARQTELDWPTRYKIIAGIARGMLYLHEDSRLRIIHRDLKASNVLLDSNMSPKISDFGMAKIFGGGDELRGLTNRVVGTYGYMAPEYAMQGSFSVKLDVYSFGVLVLEIISGRKNCNFSVSDNGLDLLSYAWKLWHQGSPLELLDPTLRSSCATNEVARCIHMGLLCVQDSVEDRPTMERVVLMLSSQSVTMPVPAEPLFFRSWRMEQSRFSAPDRSTRKSVPSSRNDVSMSALDPR